MTHLYGARGSFPDLRPKNTIKILTQSAENWTCMGKWARDFFSKTRRFQMTEPFHPSADATLVPG